MRALSIDRSARRVSLSNGEAAAYDQLVLAMGARKGGEWHRRWGLIYYRTMLWVLASAVVLSVRLASGVERPAPRWSNITMR